MLTDAVTNRSSPFRIPVFSCGIENDIESRIVVLRKSDEQNNLVQFHSDITVSYTHLTLPTKA